MAEKNIQAEAAGVADDARAADSTQVADSTQTADAAPEEPDMEEACFQIISTVGCAKSNYIEAIGKAKEFQFDEAERLIEEGNDIYVQGHDVHMGLLQEDAQKMGSTKVPLLLVHAEDQLMQAETFRVFAEDMLDVYKKLASK